jgi:hypothetical protein
VGAKQSLAFRVVWILNPEIFSARSGENLGPMNLKAVREERGQ